jgi:hypothetical protein
LDLDCHWHRLQRNDGGALRSLRLGVRCGLTLTDPSNTAALRQVSSAQPEIGAALSGPFDGSRQIIFRRPPASN